MHGLRNGFLVALGISVAVLESGLYCQPALIDAVTPADGAVVTTPSFQVQIQLGSLGNPTSLIVELNGVDITSQLSGGPVLFTKTFGPGAPLRDSNLLRVRITSNDGHSGGNLPVSFQYAPPKAHAFVVTSPAQCPTGPLAHCTPGDFMMANDAARFVVQKAAQRELHFTGTYGGNLIDAEIVKNGVPQGNDNFYEVQPAVNIESVINAQTAEIVNDGQDGTTAIVRTCGPDDLLDDVNPSSVIASAGGRLPPGVDDVDYNVNGCTEYRLDPQTRVVKLVSTIENMQANQLKLQVGDYINSGGTTEHFTPLTDDQFDQAGVGELFADFGIEALSYYGFSDAAGVDYALIEPQAPTIPLDSSSFTQTGVSYVLYGNAVPQVLGFGRPGNFLVPAGGSNSFTRWFSVGDGSAGNAVQAFLDANGLPSGTLKGCVSDTGGNPVPGARVIAAVDSSDLGTESATFLRSHWVTGSDGCYEGRIEPGDYAVAAAKEGFPYEGGGASPALHTATVTTGGTAVQDIVLPQTGHLHVAVVDQDGHAVPARVGVVGFDPSPEPQLFTSILKANDTQSNLFYDQTRDVAPAGFTRTEYTDAAGTLAIDVEPGTYEIAVSRGNEYSLFTQEVAISAGSTTNVNAQVALVLDTTGFISSDYHVHMIGSPDSRIARRDRIAAFAGEGVDNIITTDHAYLTDLLPDIAALGFSPFVFSTRGEEVTTFDYGHFNAYPQGADPNAAQTHGATDHAGAAPPGQDFPIYGNYNLTPAQIEAAAEGKPQNAGLETVVQVNHIDSHFNPLKINTSLTPPASQMGPSEPSIYRLDPSVTNFFHAFAALELWNGYTVAQATCEFLGECTTNGRIGIWMNLLNQGIKTTAVADTDTHEYHNLRSGGARSWTPSSTDVVPNIVPIEIPRAIRAGQLVGGQGIYVQTRLLATDGSGAVASFQLGQPTQISVSNHEVQLEIDVQAPTWAPYDKIQIYRDASTKVTRKNGTVPTLFTALPTQTINKGVDFTVDTVPVNGSARLHTHKVVTFSGLTRDEWIAVVVRGTPGVSAPMFPVHPDGVDIATENPTLAALENVTVGEKGMRALGFTNALYVDQDGNGVFDPPGVSVVP